MFTFLRNMKAFVTRWVTTLSYLSSRHKSFFHIVLVCPQAATDICIHFVKCQVHERLFWEDGERKNSSPTWGNQTHDILINQTCALPQSHWLTKIPISNSSSTTSLTMLSIVSYFASIKQIHAWDILGCFAGESKQIQIQAKHQMQPMIPKK